MKDPPKNLKETGTRFWLDICQRFQLEEPHDFERLSQACSCLDIIADAEEIVKAEGLFLRNRFHELREHPGLKVIRDCRILFLRAIREMSLDSETPPESRLPGLY